MIFCDNKINLTGIKNKQEFLTKLGNNLFNLSHSNVCAGKLAIGGEYYKNYYNYICSGFFNDVIYVKNSLKSEFIYNTKYNLCNFGVFFLKDNNNIYIEIFSGNSFQIDNNLQNNIEKYLLNNKKAIKQKMQICKYDNFYLKFVEKLDIENVKIISKNKFVKEYVKLLKIKTQQSNKIVIDKNLNYKILINKKEINVGNLIKLKNCTNFTDKNLIDKINLEGINFVVNSKNLIYNKDINNFDIFYTIKIISNKLKGKTNDKNSKKLV